MRYFAATALCAAVVAAGCADVSEFQVTPAATATPIPLDTGPRLVIYRLGGTGFGDVTLQTATGTEQYADTELPNETSYRIPAGGFAYVSVQSTAAEGSVSCEIVVDGTAISRNASEGAYVIASCDGTVP